MVFMAPYFASVRKISLSQMVGVAKKVNKTYITVDRQNILKRQKVEKLHNLVR